MSATEAQKECMKLDNKISTQPAITCSKLTIVTLEQGVKKFTCSKLTIVTLEQGVKTPKRRQWRRFGVFIVNFEHILHLVLVFLMLTLSR